jgi:hypothetical protein
MREIFMIKCRENSNDISILIKPSFSVVAYGFILVFSIFSSAVQADSVKLSESQTEKVKCVTTKQDGKKYTECFKLTTGKFSITAKISPSTFENYGIVLEDITEETPLAINIGSFEFSEILSSDEKHVLKSNSLKGAWYRYHEVCKPKKVKVDGEWEELLICKDVKHTTTKVSASRSGATITVTGNSSGVEGYGDSVFNQLCSSEGTGIQKVPASIVVGDITIESNVAVNCRVNTKTQTAKTAQEFELVNMVINAKLAP